LWTATLRAGHVYVGSATPAVANGVVYLTWSQTTYHSAQRWLVAFPTTCTSPCTALLVTTAGFYQLLGPAVAGRRLYLAGGPYQGPGAVFVFGQAEGRQFDPAPDHQTIRILSWGDAYRRPRYPRLY